MEIHAVKTWYDRRLGVVTVDDDVQNVVRDVKAVSEQLHVFYNYQTDGYDIVERCLDGTDRLVFSTPHLDQRIVHRLRRADHWYGEDVPNHVLGDDEDVIARVDEHNDRLQEEIDEEAKDRLRGAGERLAWALDNCKDQHSVGGQILVPRSVKPDG